MPRSRYIKPAFFIDEKIGALPPVARMFFVGLWCEADREGRLKYSPKELKWKLLAYDRVKVEDLVLLLLERKFIVKYEVEGAFYLHIRNFKKHQHPHHTEQPSSFPPPPEKRTVVQPLENGEAPPENGNGNGNTYSTTCGVASAEDGIQTTAFALPSVDASQSSASPRAGGNLPVAAGKNAKISAATSPKAKRQPADIDFIVERRDDGSWNLDAAKFVNITDETVAGWAEAFPAVNVKAEISKARQWLISKWPSSRKRLYRRFLTAWMMRTQERGGDRGSNGGYSAGRPNFPADRPSRAPLALSDSDRERRDNMARKMGMLPPTASGERP